MSELLPWRAARAILGVMSHRRYTEKERKAWLAKFDHSTTSAAAFCRKHRLSYQSFLCWRREEKRRCGPVAEFVEVEVPRPATGRGATEAVELAFPGGLVLRVIQQPAQRP